MYYNFAMGAMKNRKSMLYGYTYDLTLVLTSTSDSSHPVFRIRIRPDPKLFGIKDPDPKLIISDLDPDPPLFHTKLKNMF